MDIGTVQLADILAKFSGRHAEDDEDVAFVVKYVGDEASATVTVADATGDITFKHGDASSEAVDDTIGIGGSDGIIDSSDTDADTFGEVVDHINASANWEAYLVDALRADSADDALLLLSEETISPNEELELNKDTSVALDIGLAIDNVILKGMNFDNENVKHSLLKVVSVNTYGTGTNFIEVYKMNRSAKTEELIFKQAGGDTTVEDTIDLFPAQLDADAGDYLLVKMVGSAACTGYLTVLGKAVNFANPGA